MITPPETKTVPDARLTRNNTSQLFFECRRRVEEYRSINDNRWSLLAIRGRCYRTDIAKTSREKKSELAELFQAFPTMQLWREVKRRWEVFIDTDSQFASLVYRCEAHILEMLHYRNEKETDNL